MNRAICLLLALAIAVCLSACMDVSQYVKLAVCGSYAVPGMMCFDLKGFSFSCKVLETDSYGRVLFSYESVHHIEQCKRTYFVICQKMNGESVFFYEDICYTDVNEDLEALKAVNDWGKTLDSSKMTKRPVRVSMDLVMQFDTTIRMETVKETFCQDIGVSKDSVLDSFVLDQNEQDQILLCIILKSEDITRKYLIISDVLHQIQWMLLDEETDYNEVIPQFKQENGWEYTT